MIHVRIPVNPTREASPNAHRHWRHRHRASKDDREIARLATMQALPDGCIPLAGNLHMEITVAWGKGRRRLDNDNAIASCKHLIDGVFDTLGIDDRAVSRLTLAQVRDPDGPGWTEIVVSPERSNP